MAFCRNCGAQIADENANCENCSGAEAYYQPVPYGPPPRQSPDEDVGKALGIVAIIIAVVIIVTIVLAAVLYVMVIGMGSPGDYVSTPVGAWSIVGATSSTSGEMTFGTFSDSVPTTSLQIYIQENGTNIGYVLWTGDTSSTTVSMNWVGGPSGAYAEYMDFNIAGGDVNSGDKITLSGLEPDTTYSFQVFHIPTDSTIIMMGTESFTTEP